MIGLSVLAGATFCLPHSGQVLALLVMLTAGVSGTSKFVAQHSLVFSSYDVAMGRENAEHYASRQLDHYAAARYVRESLPSDARLLFIGETRPYYFRREAVAPSAYDRHPLQRWVEESPSAEALVGRLAAEGITHVVLNVHEFKRVHDNYGVLAFSGEGAQTNDRRLKDLPRVLTRLFSANGVHVFEVPSPIR